MNDLLVSNNNKLLSEDAEKFNEELEKRVVERTASFQRKMRN